jgi:transposase InsO family protein
MKAVCDSLGVARSNVHARLNRPDTWKDERKGRTSSDDQVLIDELKVEISTLPSYGYRRTVALVNRRRQALGNPRVNHKRGYRVMKAAGLLLPKAPQRASSSRPHDGKVAVDHSDTRWCSDGFEIRCDSGDTVTATFTKDCCDREILAWRAWPGRGLPGEPVREMLIEAVEKRFGSTEGLPSGHRLEFLSDNGGAYIATDTKKIARELGLQPIHTPVCSPQSNGMAESFVNTFRRDYLSRMDLSDPATVLSQLPAAFEHFNSVHPHSSLKLMSPREFRHHRQRLAHSGGPASNCA